MAQGRVRPMTNPSTLCTSAPELFGGDERGKFSNQILTIGVMFAMMVTIVQNTILSGL